MQCSCGADASYEINTYNADQYKACLEFAYPKVPEGYPVNVKRAACKACKRQSVSFSYMTNGVILKEGEVLHPNGDIYDRDGNKVRGLQQPVLEQPKKPSTTAKRLW